jgi:glyoxylase-like metal-dependent hydrolase (beta-lactamase superfamily II)
VPTLPKRLLEGPDARLELGGTVFEFRHRGGGHTPGDMMVWLPQAQVAFAGDIVYVDRLLAVLPVSSTKAWLDAFTALEQLAPKHIVPGHGRVTDLATARAQTRAYLEALRAHMKRAVDQGADVSEASEVVQPGAVPAPVERRRIEPGQREPNLSRGRTRVSSLCRSPGPRTCVTCKP